MTSTPEAPESNHESSHFPFKLYTRRMKERFGSVTSSLVVSLRQHHGPFNRSSIRSVQLFTLSKVTVPRGP